MRPAMPHRHVVPARFALVVGLALLLAAPALAGDIILMKSGRTVGTANSNIPPTEENFDNSTFTISEENLDKVLYTISGVPTPQEVKSDEIDRIFHDPSTIPTGLTRGKHMIDGGQFEDAFDVLGSVAADKSAPKWAQAEAAYLQGVALWSAGALDDAAKTFDDFLVTWKNSRYVPDATKANARIKLAKGDVAGARSAFEALKKLKGLPESELLEVDYWINWIDEQVAVQKSDKAGLEKAMKGYETLLLSLKGRSGLEDLIGKCQVGRIGCLMGLGRYAEGEQEASKLVESNKDPLVRAGAYTLLGRAIVLQTAGKNDRAKFKEALLHFLKVVTLYGDTPGAEDWNAESLFRAGELFNELRPMQTATEEEKADALMARMRAQREWRECVQRYPSSQWAKKARASMGGS